LVTCCGGQVFADVSPSGGRHVFILFSSRLPWRDLRDLRDLLQGDRVQVPCGRRGVDELARQPDKPARLNGRFPARFAMARWFSRAMLDPVYVSKARRRDVR
jgi:hypothetical protein